MKLNQFINKVLHFTQMNSSNISQYYEKKYDLLLGCEINLNKLY